MMNHAIRAGEFDGDTSPEALAAWERYLETPANPAMDFMTAQQIARDAFTAAWDAAWTLSTEPEPDLFFMMGLPPLPDFPSIR